MIALMLIAFLAGYLLTDLVLMFNDAQRLNVERERYGLKPVQVKIPGVPRIWQN